MVQITEQSEVPWGSRDGLKESNRVAVLIMLLLAYIFNIVDRQIVSILAIAIKADLNLTDTQLGLMGGLAFSIFYCMFAIPIARLADLSNRSMIITVSLALWSAMTALCGLAQNFIQLFLARVAVGIGEAGGVAPSYSLISDYFPPEQRARAFSFHSMGYPIGGAAGVMSGGLIVTYIDWRWAFFIVGGLGLLLVLPFKAIVREPARGRYDRQSPPAGKFLEVVRLAARKPSFWTISLGAATSSSMSYGTMFWLPSFFVRSFEISVLNASLIFGMLLFFGGTAGLLLGGAIADRVGRKGRRAYTLIPAFGFLGAVPFYLLGLWSSSLLLTCLFMFVPTALSLVWLGPTLTAVQHLAPPTMRTTTAALFMTISNIFGLTMGIVVLGAVSDMLQQTFGAESLRYSIAAGTIFYILAFLLFLAASRSIERDWLD